MPKAVSPDLLDFKAQLDLHRQAHPKRSRLPEHLWQQAVSLLERHSLSAICRVTHLHSQGLLKRINSSSARSQSPPAPQTFLHLDSAALSSSPPEISLATPNLQALSVGTSAYRLSLERSDGSRLTLQVPNSEWSRLETLYRAFLHS